MMNLEKATRNRMFNVVIREIMYQLLKKLESRHEEIIVLSKVWVTSQRMTETDHQAGVYEEEVMIVWEIENKKKIVERIVQPFNVQIVRSIIKNHYKVFAVCAEENPLYHELSFDDQDDLSEITNAINGSMIEHCVLNDQIKLSTDYEG